MSPLLAQMVKYTNSSIQEIEDGNGATSIKAPETVELERSPPLNTVESRSKVSRTDISESKSNDYQIDLKLGVNRRINFD